MISWRHLFQSAKGDGPDSTLVRPSNWNADHVAETDSTTPIVVGRQSPGAGPLEELPLNVLFPSGIVVPYAGVEANVPAGWLLCHGQSVNQVDFPSLYAAIGTTYGAGPGPATFALPDLRGVVIGGKSNMGGADRGNLPGGGTLGQYLGAASVGGLPVNVSVSGSVSVTVGGTLGGQVDAGFASAGGSAGGSNYATTGAPVSVSGNLGGGGSFSGGGSGGTTVGFGIIQPTVIMNAIIKT
jgi:microcystin-dependent protein